MKNSRRQKIKILQDFAPKIASPDQAFLRNDMGHLALPIQTLIQLEIMQ
jgi:hypothetical protein